MLPYYCLLLLISTTCCETEYSLTVSISKDYDWAGADKGLSVEVIGTGGGTAQHVLGSNEGFHRGSTNEYTFNDTADVGYIACVRLTAQGDDAILIREIAVGKKDGDVKTIVNEKNAMISTDTNDIEDGMDAQLSLTLCVCKEGQVLNKSGSGTCVGCPLNTRSTEYRRFCSPCAAGSASAPGSTDCVECGKGKYRNTSMTLCTECALNRVTTEAGMSECTGCELGFAPDAEQAVCVACASGQHRDENSTTCTPCPDRTYTEQRGSVRCRVCAEGQVASADRASCEKETPALVYGLIGAAGTVLVIGVVVSGRLLFLKCSSNRRNRASVRSNAEDLVVNKIYNNACPGDDTPVEDDGLYIDNVIPSCPTTADSDQMYANHEIQ